MTLGSLERRALPIALDVYSACALVARGGLATGSHPGDVHHYSTFADLIRQGQIPYRDFFMEYPPAALVPFLVPEIWPAHYHAVFKVTMFLCGAAVILVVARIARPTLMPLLLVAVAPLVLGPVFLTRYDLWPALLAVAALAALLDERWAIGTSLIALTIAAKLFAVALIPLAVIHIYRRGGRAALRRGVVAFIITSIIVWGPFLLLGPGGVRFSLREQLGRGLQIESLGASVLLVADKLGLYDTHWVRGLSIDLGGRLPRAVGAATTLLEGAAILFVGWLYAARQSTRARFVAAYAASATAFVAFGKVLSPQFVIWLVPLVAVVADPLLIGLLIAVLVTTQLDVIYGDWGLRYVNWSVWLLALRNALLLALFVELLRRIARAARLRAGGPGLDQPASDAPPA